MIYYVVKKKYILCEERFDLNNSSNTIRQNIIWVIWDVIIKISKLKQKNVEIIVNNIFELFKIKYVLSFNKKRIHMIYNAIQYLIIDNINYDIKVLDKICNNLEHNINITFQQLKKFENGNVTKILTKKEEKISKYKDIYNNLY